MTIVTYYDRDVMTYIVISQLVANRPNMQDYTAGTPCLFLILR